MQLFYIRRPGVADGANGLDAAFTRMRAYEESPSTPRVQWLHSYALREPDGRLGLACLFQADSAQALRRHADVTRLPAAEIVPVARTLALRAFAPTRVHLIRRRSAWNGDAEVERAAAAARHVADIDMPLQVSWLRSHIVNEHDGALGSVCLFQAIDTEALTGHAQRAGLPVDEIVPVLGRIVFRQEPLDRPAPLDAAAI